MEKILGTDIASNEQVIPTQGSDSAPTKPGVLNHNIAFVVGGLQGEFMQNSNANTMIQNILKQASEGNYKSPMQVQGDIFEIHSTVGADANAKDALNTLMSTATLKSKLPVFNIDYLTSIGSPLDMVNTAMLLNKQYVDGTDAASVAENNAQNDTPDENSDENSDIGLINTDISASLVPPAPFAEI